MSKITIWHNPRCSKSREAVDIAQECKSEIAILKYLDSTPSEKEIEETLVMLGFASAREWMRTKEDIYVELNLKDETDEKKLIHIMAQNPKLIERPVIIKNNKAIIGRPTSIIAAFINA